MPDNTFSIDALLEQIVAHNASDLHTTGRFAAYASRARARAVRTGREPRRRQYGRTSERTVRPTSGSRHRRGCAR